VGTICPAAQLVVRWRGEEILARADGWLVPDKERCPTRPDTLFDLASLTKLFTTTTFMTLVEAGDVALDQPVYTVLPELDEVRPIQPYEDPLEPGAFVTVSSLAPSAAAPPSLFAAAPPLFAEGLLTEADVGRETLPNSNLFAESLLTEAGDGRETLPNSNLFAEGLLTEVQGDGQETLPNEIIEPLPNESVETLSHRKGEVDARRITFRHLLTHSAGLPAWRPLNQQPSAEAARQLALTTFFSYPPGTRVIYSDIGLILVGLSIERLTGQSLPAAMQTRVFGPLNLQHTRYLPLSAGRGSQDRDGSSIAPTEFCRWRKRRIVGEVHDENAWRLGGIAGHAGLFSTAHDVATLGQLFLDGGAPLLRAETVAEMTRLQMQDGNARRGLGFGLWSPDPEASGNPFSRRAFGHTGFTGTSLWIDPARDLVVALLTNEVYNGRKGRGILSLRLAIHRAVVDAIDRWG
jgi:CubicO group peptidase (beta-lactamase class C family)